MIQNDTLDQYIVWEHYWGQVYKMSPKSKRGAKFRNLIPKRRTDEMVYQ